MQTYCNRRLTIELPPWSGFQIPAGQHERISLARLSRRATDWPQDISAFEHTDGYPVYLDIYARTVVYGGTLFELPQRSDAFIRHYTYTVEVELRGERCALHSLTASLHH